MSSRLALALALALLLIRLPSLAQPMGADQSLYAYVGERIREGGLPYRDAWDQKPPAIHFLYAAMRTIWADDGVVAAADLAAAATVAWLLFKVGGALGPPGTGVVAGLLFLLLSNPAFTRLGGIRLRSQCETFIAVAVTAAFLFLAARRASKSGARGQVTAAGVLFGIAFTLKYNAAVFALAGAIALWLWKRFTIGNLLRLVGGFLIPAAALPLVFAIGGALRPLYDATIQYNIQYSGETYTSALAPLDARRCRVSPAASRSARSARTSRARGVGGGGVCIDRDQRQPGASAVFRPGQSGACARRRVGRRVGMDVDAVVLRSICALRRRGGSARRRCRRLARE
jgi:hypothetical protein